MTETRSIPWACYNRLLGRDSKNSLQEKSSCPLCGTEEATEIYRLDDFQFFEDQDGSNRALHRVVMCSTCGTLRCDPWYTPEGQATLFEKAGESYGHCDADERVRWILKNCGPSGRVVEIGCGEGTLLGQLPAGFHCAGIDSDPHLIGKARERSPDISFYSGSDLNCPELERCDLVLMFHVLEHLRSPLETLRALRSGVPDNARLVVEVPVMDSAIKYHGPDLTGFFSLAHFTHFSKFSLKRLLRRAGWNIIFQQDMEGYNGRRVIAVKGESDEMLPSRQEIMADIKTTQNYLKVRDKSVDRIKKLISRLAGENRILIWGAGHHIEHLDRCAGFFRSDCQYLIVDRDPMKQGTRVHGVPVVAPEDIPGDYWGDGEEPVVISSYIWRGHIRDNLLRLGVAPDRIVSFYD